jgi:hypothetical protein
MSKSITCFLANNRSCLSVSQPSMSSHRSFGMKRALEVPTPYPCKRARSEPPLLSLLSHASFQCLPITDSQSLVANWLSEASMAMPPPSPRGIFNTTSKILFRSPSAKKTSVRSSQLSHSKNSTHYRVPSTHAYLLTKRKHPHPSSNRSFVKSLVRIVYKIGLEMLGGGVRSSNSMHHRRLLLCYPAVDYRRRG